MWLLMFLVVIVIAIVVLHHLGTIDVETISMEKGNRMVRIGGGLYNDTPFIRVDSWWFGLRITW